MQEVSDTAHTGGPPGAARELRRRAYLQALGVDGYVSRRALPGAARTHRLVPVPGMTGAQAAVAPPAGATDTGTALSSAAPSSTAPSSAAPSSAAPSVTPEVSAPPPAAAGAAGGPGAGAAAAVSPSTPAREANAVTGAIDAFSIAAVSAGGWLWLEELEHGLLTREQLQMIRSMALALGGELPAKTPETTQFDWPIHRNTQFDLGEEAARAGLQGFVSRQLQRHGSVGVVILGNPCGRRLGPAPLGGLRCVETLSTAAMLADPRLKPRAWRDLQTLLASP